MATDRKILFEDFTKLKSKIKAEMLRRSGTGSVSAYGGSTYDYSDTTGGIIKKEHYEKNIVPLRRITTNALPTEDGDREITEAELLQMDTKVTLLASISTTSSSTGCDASCTGLCLSSCFNSCTTGCTNSCSGCGGSCSYGCSGCSSTCRGGCSGTCENNCKGDCVSTCGRDTCTATCGGCTASCWPNCSGACHVDKKTSKGGDGVWFLQITKQK